MQWSIRPRLQSWLQRESDNISGLLWKKWKKCIMSLRVPIGTLFFINLKKYYVISIDILRNIIYNKSINKDEIKKGGAKWVKTQNTWMNKSKKNMTE